MNGTSTTMIVEVFPDREKPLEVTCQARANSSKLTIDRVSFHALTDEQYQGIVDAIELYLMRKRERDRKPPAAAAAPAVEDPNAKV